MKKNKIYLPAFLLALVIAILIYKTEGQSSEVFPTAIQDTSETMITVKLKPKHTMPKLINGTVVNNLFGDVYILHGNNLSKLLLELKKYESEIEYVEENHKANVRTLPTAEEASKKKPKLTTPNPVFNDKYISNVWSFNDASDGGVSVTAAYQHLKINESTPIIVAVIDTGVDYTHEDLKNSMWINKKEIAGDKIDNDNNGYTDDIYGINTLNRDATGHATSNVMPTHPHGTHVSGTIAATQNNNIGIAGIASSAKIMAIRTVPDNGDEKDIDVAEGMIYAAKNGAKIINCSFGKTVNEGKKLIPDTLNYIASTYGVLVVAAAGNDSANIDVNKQYPASFDNDNLLVIASTTESGSMSGFSNYGIKSVDVAAPGSKIYSTMPGNRYDYMSGTSMATPTTVGVAAELWSQYPKLTYKDIIAILMKSVTPTRGFETKVGSGGRIDLMKALELARDWKPLFVKSPRRLK